MGANPKLLFVSHFDYFIISGQVIKLFEAISYYMIENNWTLAFNPYEVAHT